MQLSSVRIIKATDRAVYLDGAMQHSTHSDRVNMFLHKALMRHRTQNCLNYKLLLQIIETLLFR